MLLHVMDTDLLTWAHRAESMLRLHLDRDADGKVALLWAGQLCQRMGVEAEMVQVQGAASPAILAQAVRRRVDLVAIGRGERRGPEQVALGRVSDAVLRGCCAAPALRCYWPGHASSRCRRPRTRTAIPCLMRRPLSSRRAPRAKRVPRPAAGEAPALPA